MNTFMDFLQEETKKVIASPIIGDTDNPISGVQYEITSPPKMEEPVIEEPEADFLTKYKESLHRLACRYNCTLADAMMLAVIHCASHRVEFNAETVNYVR